MERVSVRLKGRHFMWLKVQAQLHETTCAGLVRDLISAQMKRPHFLEYFKQLPPQRSISPLAHRGILYSIMACKLLEELVLNTEDGKKKYDAAYHAMLQITAGLHLSLRPKDKLNLLLYPAQSTWLNQQAKILQKPIASLVRKIIMLAWQETIELAEDRIDLTAAELEGIKAVIMSFTLLKNYIMSVYAGGDSLVESCVEEAEEIYSKSCSQV